MSLRTALPAMLAAGALIAVGASPAQAQSSRPFTWASTLTPTCTNVSCSFQLQLTGIGADLIGTPMSSVGINFGPVAIPGGLTGGGTAVIPAPVTSPGYIAGFFIDILSGTASFAPGTYNTGNLLCTAMAQQLACTDPTPFAALPQFTAVIPMVGDPLAGAGTQFTFSGTAYLGNSAGISVLGTNGVLYDVGAFNGRTSASVIPEPGTMTLLASGLVGLGVVARRRHRR